MPDLSAWDKILRKILGAAGRTEFLGVPLDIPAHFFGAWMIYYLLFRLRLRPIAIWAILMGLALLKEVYDLSALLHHGDTLEPVKDLVITGLGGAAAEYFLKRFQKKSQNLQ